MKTVLITGGAGFLGSHLCDLFLSRGYKVICLDNFITGSIENIRHNLKNKKFKLIRHDISKLKNIKEKINLVLHFASPASPIDYAKLPIETLKVGSLGTMNALEIARKNKARLVMASTSEIYGDPKVSPQKETYWGNVNSIGPRSCYDEAKRFSEALCAAYFRKHKMDIRVARIFNTYGPRMRKNDGRVVPNFIMQALSGKPLTIYGDGKQTRSFCYVSDLIEGILKLALLSSLKFAGSNFIGRMVNLGNPREFTIIELADIIARLSGKKLPISEKKLPGDDPRQRQPDIKKAKKILGWRPKVPLMKGLKETLLWVESELKNASWRI